MAPLVVGNRIVVGVGGDSLDNPGFLEARAIRKREGLNRLLGSEHFLGSRVRNRGPTRKRCGMAGE